MIKVSKFAPVAASAAPDALKLERLVSFFTRRGAQRALEGSPSFFPKICVITVCLVRLSMSYG